MPKGGARKGAGRKPDGVNIGKALRQMAYDALLKEGGTKYLIKQAQDNPKSFMSLIQKMTPSEDVLHVEANEETVDELLNRIMKE